jgi:hypothetical protein
MVNAFNKIIRNHRLYEATIEDMEELKNWPDPAVVRNYELYIPIFKDIQTEKEEAEKFMENIIIRQANEDDKEEVINLSNRLFYGEKYEGIKRITDKDFFIYIKTGKIFVATTESGYVVGVHIIRIGDAKGNLVAGRLLLLYRDVSEEEVLERNYLIV